MLIIIIIVIVIICNQSWRRCGSKRSNRRYPGEWSPTNQRYEIEISVAGYDDESFVTTSLPTSTYRALPT